MTQYTAAGTNGISATIICDSISASGVRMTTFEDVFHRWILAENNTHRAISKNLQSSRAVPLAKAIEMVREHTAYPVHYGKNQAGMQAKEELDANAKDTAKNEWDNAMYSMIESVQELAALGAHKQWASRLLEPFVMTKAVQSGTNWDNLMWLRNDEEAQPEYEVLAKCKQECFDNSVPQLLHAGEWHLPYIKTDRDSNGVLVYMDATGEVLTLEEAQKISASCAAQVSYRRLNDTKEKALEIYAKLFSGRKPHLSPTEHQATPINAKGMNASQPHLWTSGITHMNREGKFCSGNLEGWVQYRQTLPNNVFKK
jgi:hypothetical protein